MLGVGLVLSLVQVVFKKQLNERKIRRIGIRNAKLLESNKVEKCFICLLEVNYTLDCLSTKFGWYHSKCMTNLLED